MGLSGKIYYITRTWTDLNDATSSCAMLRVRYADILREIMPVVVVTPSYDGELRCDDEQISIPYSNKNNRYRFWLQRLNLIDDYLDVWVNYTFEKMRTVVKKEDVVFATTGGELGTIKLAAMLKDCTGCKMIIHFHDPVDGVRVWGEHNIGYRGLDRSKKAYSYIDKADFMITSCETYRDVLRDVFPNNKQSIQNHFFGYINKIKICDNKNLYRKKINVVYSGAMTKIQHAEILYNAFRGMNNINIIYITGNALELKRNMPEKNVICIPLMPYDKYLNYMVQHADIGFVSLTRCYSGLCVPSKIYDYINLGLPILASLPDGAAKTLINQNQYGIACDDGDVRGLQSAIQVFQMPKRYEEYRKHVIEDRDSWWVKKRENEFLNYVKCALEK